MSVSPQYFEQLFEHDEDPWAFRTRWYEQRKRDLTLACLPRQYYTRIFEPACANGELSAALAERTAVARVLQEKGGKRTIVSHHNKATKGRIVRGLLGEPKPRTVDDLAGALGAAGYRVELAPPAGEGKPWTIDVVVKDL